MIKKNTSRPSARPGSKPGPKPGSKPLGTRPGSSKSGSSDPKPPRTIKSKSVTKARLVAPTPTSTAEDMRLNKYVALSGIASRRAADSLIIEGKVWVNGNEVREPGHRVKEKDRVTYLGKIIKPDQNLIYLLMNKPKDTITTSHDEKGRKTVLDIVQFKIKERVYPIGRLDRMTTGLLLLTNDGDLAKTLSHPSSEVRKIYHVVLDKVLDKLDYEKIIKGLILDDGPAQLDGISFIDGSPANEVGVTLHSGKNRLVRRIFEHLGYEVIKLDRVAYAGLNKKDLPRGHFRHLTEKEVTLLKHFGLRKKKKG